MTKGEGQQRDHTAAKVPQSVARGSGGRLLSALKTALSLTVAEGDSGAETRGIPTEMDSQQLRCGWFPAPHKLEAAVLSAWE
jgi:hypothetical protein